MWLKLLEYYRKHKINRKHGKACLGTCSSRINRIPVIMCQPMPNGTTTGTLNFIGNSIKVLEKPPAEEKLRYR
jgi:hypothetical protein